MKPILMFYIGIYSQEQNQTCYKMLTFQRTGNFITKLLIESTTGYILKATT